MNQAILDTTIPAIFVSHKRGRRTIHPRQALLKINNVADKETATKYIDNAVYACWTTKEGKLVENHGVIRRHHGGKGLVRAIFERNLAPQGYGTTVYVKLYKIESEKL